MATVSRTGKRMWVLKRLPLGVKFTLFVAATAHCLFSWIGFNPTDDGFFLAHSRRILEGQIPHLNFISVRPPLTALLHIPVVALGGDYTYWLSRGVVWLEFAAIAWAWVAIAQKLRQLRLLDRDKTWLALVVFIFTAHTFPPMVWNSVDGLLCVSLGLYLLIGQKTPWVKAAGYLILGLAPLTRQNFALLLPLTLIVTGDWRRPAYWLCAVAPATAFVLYLGFVGGLSAASEQLFAHTELAQTGFFVYLHGLRGMAAWVGVVLGAAAGRLRPTARYRAQAASALAYGALAAGTAGLWFNLFPQAAFLLFGVAVGYVVTDLLNRQRDANWLRLEVLIVAVAWSVSISNGYNTPALAGGILLIVPLLGLLEASVDRQHAPASAWKPRVVVLGAALAVFAYGRLAFPCSGMAPPRDAPAWELTSDLGEVWPGGHLIRTSTGTYRFLEDLERAVAVAGASRYAIVPDCPGYWAVVGGDPLPVPWPQTGELPTQRLVDVVTRAIELQKGQLVVLVEKTDPREVYRNPTGAPRPASGIPYVPIWQVQPVASYCLQHLSLVAETKYFWILR